MTKKRRTFSPQFKAGVVLEILSGERTAAEACRHYKISTALLSRWKTQFQTSAFLAFGDDTRVETQQQRIEELERVLGQKTLELEIAKKALSISRLDSV